MNRNFIRSIAILSGSNLLAQGINFITYLILPKFYYSPKDFGVFGLFLAIYYVVFEVINLKMDQSIMLPDNQKDAYGLLGFSWFVSCTLSVLFFIGLLLVNQAMDWMHNSIPFLLASSLLLGGFIQPGMVLLNRNGAYMRMGNVRILQALVTLAGSVSAYYWFQQTINGLILGFIAGQVVAAIAILGFVSSPKIHIAGRSVVNRYLQFIKYGSLSSMISTFSRNLPVFIIKPVFGEATLGWYTLATKYLNAPIGIFSTSIAQVYFKDATKASAEELHQLTRTVIKNIFILVLIPALVIAFFGGDLFRILFGDQWESAGIIMQVLIFWYYVAYASGPVSMLLDVKMKLKWELTYNILLLLGRLAALLSVLWLDNVFIVLGIYAAVGISFNLVLIKYLLKISHRNAERS